MTSEDILLFCKWQRVYLRTQTTHSGLTVPLMTFPASSPHTCHIYWYVKIKMQHLAQHFYALFFPEVMRLLVDCVM